MIRFVIASFRFSGLHQWASQPTEATRPFLSTDHRHEFHVEVGVSVDHDDRQIEILELKQVTREALYQKYRYADTSPGDLWIGSQSCEMLAAFFLDVIEEKYGFCKSWCRVMEDGENGAELRQDR